MRLSKWLVWVYATVVVAGYPVVNFLYWPAVLNAGVLPTKGDSIAIPMFGSIFFAIICSPIVLGLTWFCMRRYSVETTIFAWRSDRPIRSWLSTALFGGLVALLVVHEVVSLSLDYPWYERIWTPYVLVVIAWLLALRAAVIEQRRLDS